MTIDATQDERNFPHGELTEKIIGAAIKVHRALGSGLLESAYEICFADEMERRNINFQRQIPLPVEFESRRLDCGYRLDFVVEDTIIIEVKAVEALMPIHTAQLLTYLRLAHKDVGLLINFHSIHLRDGIKRLANTTPRSLSATSASLR